MARTQLYGSMGQVPEEHAHIEVRSRDSSRQRSQPFRKEKAVWCHPRGRHRGTWHLTCPGRCAFGPKKDGRPTASCGRPGLPGTDLELRARQWGFGAGAGTQ